MVPVWGRPSKPQYPRWRRRNWAGPTGQPGRQVCARSAAVTVLTRAANTVAGRVVEVVVLVVVVAANVVEVVEAGKGAAVVDGTACGRPGPLLPHPARATRAASTPTTSR